MTEERGYKSNRAESRAKKSVIQNPNLSKDFRLKRKRKSKMKSSTPAKRRRLEKKRWASEQKNKLEISKFQRNKLRRIWSESDKNFLKEKSSYDSFLSVDYEKPDWVNAEMRFTLSGDSSLSSESSQSSENDQPKFSEIPIPEYIKETAFRAEFRDYELGKVLGAGAFGLVISATRINDNLSVALKFVQKSSVKEFKKMNGFEIPSEAYFQRQARHRHVIEIYEVVVTDEFYVYVMERPQDCKDLFEVIHERDNLDQPLTENEVRRYFAQILRANISCEENGVLHRDIKPENIIVDMRTDEAKLIDFGLASEVQSEPFTHFRGTPHYMPPEYSQSKKYDGCQGTVWQMGILLVDMLSPEIPAFKHSHLALRIPPTVPQHLSTDAKDLIYSLLDTTPGNRPTLKQTLKHPWLVGTD